MRFIASIATIAALALSVSAQESGFLQAQAPATNQTKNGNSTVAPAPGKPPKKPSKMDFSPEDVTTLITNAWGIPLLTAVADDKGYVIGYAHTGADVKAKSVITEAQADSILQKDIKNAAQCVQSTVWNQFWNIFTQGQAGALVSFAQSVGCTNFKNLLKKQVTKTTVAADLNNVFEGLITVADGNRTSDYLTERRTAERTLFGITAQ